MSSLLSSNSQDSTSLTSDDENRASQVKPKMAYDIQSESL